MNIIEFLRLKLGIFRGDFRDFPYICGDIFQRTYILKIKRQKKISKAQQLCENILIDQDEEPKINKKLKYQVLLVKMKVK